MFRRCNRRLGHQLIKEPLGNEENTYARGRRTVSHTLHEMQILAAVGVAGVLGALYSMRNASKVVPTTITANGKIQQSL